MTAMVMASYWDLSAYLPKTLADSFATNFSSPVNGAVLAALVYICYYLYLSPTLLGATAATLVVLVFYCSVAWKVSLGATAWQSALAVHIIGWVAQFYGHGVHEGTRPALLDNLWMVRWVLLASRLACNSCHNSGFRVHCEVRVPRMLLSRSVGIAHVPMR